MAILDESLAFLLEKAPSPPVIEEIVINPGFTGLALGNGHMGLAMSIRRGARFADAETELLLRSLIGTDARTAAYRLGTQADVLLRSVYVALNNALCRPFLEVDYLQSCGYRVEIDPPHYLDQYVRKDQEVVMVGFGGLVRSIAQAAGQVYVTELEPDLFRSTVFDRDGVRRGPDDVKVVPAEAAEQYLRRADVVFVTGSALVSDTMEDLLALSEGKKVIVYGWSASLLPDPLFRRGVAVVATSRVTNTPAMLEILRNAGGTVERLFAAASESVIITRSGN